MKHYEAYIAPSAELQIRADFHFIYHQSPQNAKKWLQELYQKIDTLERMPERCGLGEVNW